MKPSNTSHTNKLLTFHQPQQPSEMNLTLLHQNVFTLRSVFYAAHSIKNHCSVSEAYIIVLLFEKPRNMHQILRETDRSRSTISHILKNLTDNKYITISPEGEYSLTKNGLAIYEKIISCVTSATCR